MPAELRTRLASGELGADDFAWHDGLVDWQPLSEVLSAFSLGLHAAPSATLRPSGFGKASFIIALAGGVAWIAITIAAGVADSKGTSDSSPVMMIVGCAFLLNIVANLAGMVLGIIALTKPASNKWMAVTGLVVNFTELAGVGFLVRS